MGENKQISKIHVKQKQSDLYALTYRYTKYCIHICRQVYILTKILYSEYPYDNNERYLGTYDTFEECLQEIIEE